MITRIKGYCRFFLIGLICFFIVLPASAKRKNPERWYQERYCQGQLEVKLDDSTRIDCLTEEYAIEFDFAPKWAEAIGQSLYYAAKTKKKPAIVLIVERKQHIRYVRNVADLCRKLGIRLWFIENFRFYQKGY